MGPAILSSPQAISQNASSLTVPSEIIEDRNINMPTINGKDSTPQITLNGLGSSTNIMNGGNYANTHPKRNSINSNNNGSAVPTTGSLRNTVYKTYSDEKAAALISSPVNSPTPTSTNPATAASLSMLNNEVSTTTATSSANSENKDVSNILTEKKKSPILIGRLYIYFMVLRKEVQLVLPL